ncbi:hypothetical protein JTE90_000340 [Oedothorax gibbosus]|uniref:Uncharacterized protein n=1 Tax=Oedothorax gibbosus TaxID=931172 RepID=A0AAV6U245_9ARAC|nr:hypothetical protein JTE90_000340 [Oedothorax gibbosus]
MFITGPSLDDKVRPLPLSERSPHKTDLGVCHNFEKSKADNEKKSPAELITSDFGLSSPLFNHTVGVCSHDLLYARYGGGGCGDQPDLAKNRLSVS